MAGNLFIDEGDAPPNGVVDWDSDVVGYKEAIVVLNRKCTPRNRDRELKKGVLGLVYSPGTDEQYIANHSHGEIVLPQTYSAFDTEFGDKFIGKEDKRIYLGPLTDKQDEEDGDEKLSALNGWVVETALRILTGDESYTREDYVLHDCLPSACVLKGPQGTILVAPATVPRKDTLER